MQILDKEFELYRFIIGFYCIIMTTKRKTQHLH